MKKTYALFDVVGVKKAFAAGNAVDVLNKFWSAAEGWATFIANDLKGQGGVQISADVCVRTFSDSALLYTGSRGAEPTVADFWTLVRSLKSKVDAAGTSYVIVNRAEEIAPPPSMQVLTDSNSTPKYLNISGSGAAFANLFYADAAIHRKGWTYPYYAIGDDALGGNTTAESEEFAGFDGTKLKVHAWE